MRSECNLQGPFQDELPLALVLVEIVAHNLRFRLIQDVLGKIHSNHAPC